MRQAGFLAAAGIYALDHHIERLKTDHLHATQLGSTLMKLPFVKTVLPVETNIVIFELQDGQSAPALSVHPCPGEAALVFLDEMVPILDRHR